MWLLDMRHILTNSLCNANKCRRCICCAWNLRSSIIGLNGVWPGTHILAHIWNASSFTTWYMVAPSYSKDHIQWFRNTKIFFDQSCSIDYPRKIERRNYLPCTQQFWKSHPHILMDVHQLFLQECLKCRKTRYIYLKPIKINKIVQRAKVHYD